MMETGYVVSPYRGPEGRILDGPVVVRSCKVCGLPIETRFQDIEIEIGDDKKVTDAIYTEDLFTIVSDRLLELLTRLATTPFEGFRVSRRGYHLVVPKTVLRFDSKTRDTKFINKCSTCGQYYEVIGATPAFILGPEIEISGIYCTDLWFGTGANKAPLTIVGIDLKHDLVQAGIRGIHFAEAFSLSS